MQIRNRIKELRHVPASSLKPNPKNWRTHPKAQQDALRGILAEVGMADACLARELDDGSLMLIDGHLRAETIGEEVVPVLILDVNEEESDKILTTLDPLSAMAGTDRDKLAELITNLNVQSEAFSGMVAAVAENAEIFEELADTDDGDNPYTAKIDVPPYETKGEKPAISELFDESKCQELLAAIESSDVPEEDKSFLRLAAYRHVIFNFENIANYYAHATGFVQELMEDSALVIVDVDKAIENGWTTLSKALDSIYAAEQKDAE